MQIKIEVDEETMAEWLMKHFNIKQADESKLRPEITEIDYDTFTAIFTLEIPS